MAAGYSVKVNEVIIPTSEHLYLACGFPDYPQIQWDIINEVSPMKAKWIGRAPISKSREDWKQIQFKVMTWAPEVKLSQSWQKFSTLLLSTGNKNIVESTPSPKIWGAVPKGELLEGINALGRLLMRLREEYVKPNNRIKCVEPLEISKFNLLDYPIDLICEDADVSLRDSEDRFAIA